MSWPSTFTKGIAPLIAAAVIVALGTLAPPASAQSLESAILPGGILYGANFGACIVVCGRERREFIGGENRSFAPVGPEPTRHYCIDIVR